MTSPLPAIVQATSGALASACANSIAYPLDVATTRIQTRNPSAGRLGGKAPSGRSAASEILGIIQRTVHKRGIYGLYAGIGSDTTSTLLSNFLYFYAYSYLRTRVQRRKLGQRSPTSPVTNIAKSTAAVALTGPQELGIGYLAGVLSRLITTPLSVITVRLQVASDSEDEGETGVLDIVRDIYSTDGLPGFWKGFQSMIVLSANPAITLLFFQLLKRFFLRGKARDHPTALQGFILGGLSNSIAVAMLYPLILLKARLQAARKNSEPALSGGDNKSHPPRKHAKQSTFDVARGIVNVDGLSGLYRGLEAQLLKGIVTQGITLSGKQRIEDVFISAYRRALQPEA